MLFVKVAIIAELKKTANAYRVFFCNIAVKVMYTMKLKEGNINNIIDKKLQVFTRTIDFKLI